MTPSTPPSPLPRGCSRGHAVTLSSQDPGTMTRSATTQEALGQGDHMVPWQ